jgi:Secretion system C-terminal sorting domain/GEVED domain
MNIICFFAYYRLSLSFKFYYIFAQIINIHIMKKSLVLFAFLLISIFVNAQSVIVGSTNGTATSFLPFATFTSRSVDKYSQGVMIYTASELATAGLPVGATITKIEWLKANDNSITPNNTYEVWCKNLADGYSYTNRTSFGTFKNGATSVYNSSTFSVTGAANTWIGIDIPAFNYDGSNLMILTRWSGLGTLTDFIGFRANASAQNNVFSYSNSSPLDDTWDFRLNSADSKPTVRFTYTSNSCIGTPILGNTISSVNPVGNGSPFTLSVQNIISGDGVTYQWQSSFDGVNWTNVVGAIGTVHTVSQTTATYYRLNATCLGNTGSSAPIQVNMALDSDGYCIANSTGFFGFGIHDVVISNIVTEDWKGPINVGTINVGLTIPIYFLFDPGFYDFRYPSTDYHDLYAFIDFNHNKVFDSAEKIFLKRVPVSRSNEPYANPISTSLSVPQGALMGVTRIRLVSYLNMITIDPCYNGGGAAFKNFNINISNSLPIELLSFSGVVKNKSSLLKWQTATERNNSYFQIEHSINGLDFKSIGVVKGNGNSTGLKNYSFTHTNPTNGANYYRLKQVDIDGQFDYSKVVNVTIENDKISIYPNPNNGLFEIIGDITESLIRVIDPFGRVIIEQKIADNKLIDIQSQPTGLYFVEILRGGSATLTKIVKR